MSEEAAQTALPPVFPSNALIGQIGDAAPRSDVTIIGDHLPGDSFTARLGRSMRERFQAITGAGLAPPPYRGEPPGRRSIATRGATLRLSYLAAGNHSGRRVVFVHGTPGDASDWGGFLREFAADQHRLAIDRLGFGESGGDTAVVSLTEQARAIAELLDGVGGPAVVVGSSYGGPVALRLAADRPDLVAGLLLVGGAADPGHERIHPIQHVIATKPLATIMPTALARSNAELLALPGELELLADDLARVRASVTVLHGLGDTLVPAENARYLAERLTGVARLRFVLVPGAGHFLHLLSPDRVEDALTELVQSVGWPS